MPLSQAIVLAIVQGITEWLPISSTAHLFLARWLMGWPEPKVIVRFWILSFFLALIGLMALKVR